MPDAEDWSVRFYREGDDEALVDLLRSAFDRWPAPDISVEPLEYLRWKLASPEAQRSHVVAEADGEIIGCRITMARRMKVRDRVLLMRLGVDSAVHPRWHNRGVMTRMKTVSWDELARRFDLHGGTTRNEYLLRQDLRDGRRLFGNKMEVLERPPGEAPIAAQVHGWTIGAAAAFDDRVNDLWQEASVPFDLLVVRTKDYLNWRYADPRAGGFAIRLAERKGRLLGYAVLAGSGTRGRIADLFVLPERADVLASLIQDGLAHFKNMGVSRVQCWCPRHHPFRPVFRRLGFERRQTLRGVTLGAYSNDLNRELEFLSDPLAALHMCAGDTDVV